MTMGRLRSNTNHTGMMVGDVQLGDPVELDDDPTTLEWDDHRVPTGEILADGTILLDEP